MTTPSHATPSSVMAGRDILIVNTHSSPIVSGMPLARRLQRGYGMLFRMFGKGISITLYKAVLFE